MKVKSICTARRAKIIILILWIISAACGSPAIFSMVSMGKNFVKNLLIDEVKSFKKVEIFMTA